MDRGVRLGRKTEKWLGKLRRGIRGNVEKFEKKIFHGVLIVSKPLKKVGFYF